MHGYNTRLASRGDQFLSRKTTFQYEIRSIQYSGVKALELNSYSYKRISLPDNFHNKTQNTFSVQLSKSFLSLFSQLLGLLLIFFVY